MIKSRIFSEEEVQFILDNYKGIGNQDLTDLINTTFKTNYTLGQVKRFKTNHKLDSGLRGYFEKGHVPFNKGLKLEDYMSEESIERTKATRFKKGRLSHNRKPIGSERIDRDGYITVKVGEPNVWELKHRYVWETHYGPVPEGHIIVMVDGNRLNCELSNLKLVSRGANAIVNRHIKLTEDSELNRVIYSTAELENKISEVDHE